MFVSVVMMITVNLQLVGHISELVLNGHKKPPGSLGRS